MLLLALVAALPWEDALAYPTETVSVVKILGVLLFARLAACARWRARSRCGSARRSGGPASSCSRCCSRLLFAPDPADSVFDALRYALFVVFFFLVLQLTHTIEDVRRVVRVFVLSCTVAAGWGLYGFIALDLDRAAGPIEDPNDFAYLMVCALPLAGYLLHRAAEPPRVLGRAAACC